MRGRIICVEGLPRVGKTTIIQQLKERYPVISEYYEYLNGGKLAPVKTIKNYNDNQAMLLDIEEKRKKDIKQANVFVDRSFLSNLSFSFAMEKTFKKPFYKISKDLHSSKLNENKLIIPNAFIYIKCNDFEGIRERMRLSNFDEIWLTEGFIELIYNFYERYFSCYCSVPVINLTSPIIDSFDFLEKINRMSIKEKDKGVKKLILGDSL